MEFDYDEDEFLDYEDPRDKHDEDYQPAKKSVKVVKSPTPSTASSSSSKATKRKKKDLEHAAKVAICEEVRKHPAIYQITHQNYMNKITRDAIWEEISDALINKLGPSMTVQNCRKMWDALRESTR